MSFIWPSLLLLLLAIPVGAWVYRARERRRAERAATFGWMTTSDGAARTRPTGWTRRISAVCTVAGVTVLVFSLARPESVIGVPRLEGTVLLAFDVSGSMAATDVAPTRMEAAKAAALSFVAHQPASVRIGVVAFSDSGLSTQVPTHERADVEAAIRRLEPERGTSIGGGILRALTVLDDADELTSTDYYSNRSPEPTTVPTPVPAGVYAPAMIVVMTDGENTDGTNPLEAAQAARDRGVRIDTVGIGSEAGTEIEVEGFRIHTQLDVALLEAIAAATDGTYHPASAQDDLERIYDTVESRLVVRSEPFELTPLFAGLGFALLVVGGLASLRWFGRMP